jgi:hypothetical protein
VHLITQTLDILYSHGAMTEPLDLLMKARFQGGSLARSKILFEVKPFASSGSRQYTGQHPQQRLAALTNFLRGILFMLRA